MRYRPQKGARILQIQMGVKDAILGRIDRMRKGNKAKDTFALC